MGEGVRELKEKAQALLLRQSYRKAVELLDKVVALSPDDAFARKKLGETLEHLEDFEAAAQHYVHLAGALEKGGHRLQAIASCKLALRARPEYSAAISLLAALYAQTDVPGLSFAIEPETLEPGPVAPPHPDSAVVRPQPQPPPLPARRRAPAVESLSPTGVKDAEIFVNALLQLCATFSGTALVVAPQALAESVAGNTDFLWVIPFTGAAEHTVIISAQRRFAFGLAKRVFDVEDSIVTEVMATKLTHKLIGMYAGDVERAFAAAGRVVRAGPPIPVSGENATYQVSGTRTLHVPMSSDIGWVQVTVAGGV